MIASIKSSPANSVAAHPKRNRWNSEFERIHIFAAAKIRGESVGARRLDDGSFNGGSSNRSAHEELVRWRRSRLEAQVDGRTSTVASQSPRPHASVGKRRRAVVGARVIVACLGPYLFNIADGWTETRIAETQYLQASSEITCHRRLAPTASNHHGLPGYIDNKSNVRVWKTITLGTYDSVASLRDAVRCHTGQLAGKALRHPGFRVSGKKVEIDLFVLSVAELGLERDGASIAEIYARAAQLNLELCPAEVAPQLRLQYLDQPVGEFLNVAMEPLTTDNGDVVGLSVVNGGAGLALIGGDARSDSTVLSDARFVFVRPR